MKLYCITALLSSIASSVSGKELPSTKFGSEHSYMAGQKVTPKIVGGSNASAGNYPWYSALYRELSFEQGGAPIKSFYCGGQLVAKNFVLTAAHCRPEIGHLVDVGALCPYEDGNCGQRIAFRRVVNVFEDPRYKMEITSVLGYDYVMVQLDNDVDDIMPVTLDDGSYAPSYPSGKSLWSIGLGTVDVTTGALASKLQHIELSYVPENECREEYKPLNLGEATICASHEPRTGGACFGDSGGPLFDTENQVLVGLASYADVNCASTFPTVYAKIADNWSWIKNTICDNTFGEKPDICSDSPQPFTDSPTTEWCSGGADLDILVATDSMPEETAWGLIDLNSGEIVTGGSLLGFDKDESHEGNFCLPLDNDQCYAFFVFDLGGDGIDVTGDDPDYCISVNGEALECNINFKGNMESVVFPADSCSKSCKPESYRLKGKTPNFAVKTVLTIEDSSGNRYSVNEYDLPTIIDPDSDFDFHVDLCAGCYQLVVKDKNATTFSLFDEAGFTVLTQDDFSSSMTDNSREFCVGKKGDDETSPIRPSAASSLKAGAHLFLTALFVANLIL